MGFSKLSKYFLMLVMWKQVFGSKYTYTVHNKNKIDYIETKTKSSYEYDPYRYLQMEKPLFYIQTFT